VLHKKLLTPSEIFNYSLSINLDPNIKDDQKQTTTPSQSVAQKDR
jgi:hypothetical protein